MNDIWGGIVTILVAIIGVATLSVIVSKNANTSAVIGAGFSGFSQALGAAVSPITGGGFGGGNFVPHL
jgi:hypothetical protein